jgi:hypothetical protein
VIPGDVLLLSLEDSPSRLQRRFRRCFGNAAAPQGLEVATKWPKLHEGGLEPIEGWLRLHPNARLIVIDTWKKARRPSSNKAMYDEDYEALEPLQELAQRHGVTIVVVHHLRKQEADDPVEMLSGSTGLSACADGILILKRERGNMDASLQVIHREGEELELALRFDQDSTRWELAGDIDMLRLSDEARDIIAQLPPDGSAVHYKAIAESLGLELNIVKTRLSRMAKRGEVRAHGGGMYSRALDPLGNACNRSNSVASISESDGDHHVEVI